MICVFYTDPDRLGNTVFEVANNTGSYTECGRTGSVSGSAPVTVTCSSPLIGTRLQLRRDGEPAPGVLQLCEVLAIGYIYHGKPHIIRIVHVIIVIAVIVVIVVVIIAIVTVVVIIITIVTAFNLMLWAVGCAVVRFCLGVVDHISGSLIESTTILIYLASNL